MKIKFFVLTSAFLAVVTAASAQKAELTSAKSNYDKYSQFKSVNAPKLGLAALNSAKTAIDKAVVNEKTKADPSAWSYKAMIYGDLALLDSVDEKVIPLLTEAGSAVKTAAELDKDGANKDNISTARSLLAQSALNKGVREFQTKKYPDAYKSFSSGLEYLPGDTTFTYYAGLSAINAQDYPGAIEKYSELIKVADYSQKGTIYNDLSKLYAAKGDTASAIRIASEGVKELPGNAELATQQIQLYLMTGKEKEITESILAQAQKDPKNKLFPYYLGLAYNSAKDYAKSEEYYKKAIEIDPSFQDAIVNLSGLIMNTGIDLYNTANKLPASKQKEYDEGVKKANIEFDRALPYLQKAIELDPKSPIALQNLKTYYVAKKDQAKATELQKQIDALKQ